MVSLSIIFFGILGATLIPVYIALYLVASLNSKYTRYIAASGVGLTFWFFFDTMGDAAALDENSSIYPAYLFGGFSHFAIIAAFIAGLVALAVFDHYSVRNPKGSSSMPILFLIPAAIAFVMGIHSLGEGWIVGSGSASAPSGSSFLQTFLTLFGTFTAIASYPVHKFLEASIVGAAYVCYVPGGSESVRKWWHIPLLGVLFGAPSAIGSVVGYYVALDTAYFFAFGVTAALYAALRLVEPISQRFKLGEGYPAYFGPKVFLALAVGFFLLYTAALLH